jgi:hypothetical protein
VDPSDGVLHVELELDGVGDLVGTGDDEQVVGDLDRDRRGPGPAPRRARYFCLVSFGRWPSMPR